MRDRLLISVVMPLYNKGEEVSRAVKSVLEQTVSDFELIIVNDGSTDNGPRIVRSIRDPRIRVIDQENAGVAAARNRGIEEAQGVLVAFLDADDEWSPDFLATIIRLKHNFASCDVVLTSYYYSSPGGQKRLIYFRGAPKRSWEGIKNFSFSYDFDPPISMSAFAVTKEAITSIGGFTVGNKFGEHLLTWVRLLIKYEVAYSTHPCSIYWAPTSARPDRLPQYPDTVGQELERLILESKPARVSELRQITASWYRRRGIMNILLGEKKRASQEIHNAMNILGKTWDLRMLALISKTPKSVSKFILMILKRGKAINRNFKAIISK